MTYSSVTGSGGHDSRILVQAARWPLRGDRADPGESLAYGGASIDLACASAVRWAAPYDCKFCASGPRRLHARTTSAREIVEQIVQVEALAKDRIDNLVFMGMGEPMANYTNVTHGH